MPYIKGEVHKKELDALLGNASTSINTVGELNYVITRLTTIFLETMLHRAKKVGYAELSAVHAVIQDAADEFQRRVINPYEDAKCLENGDVYDSLLEAMKNAG